MPGMNNYPNDIVVKIGNKIVQIRKEKGIKQLELAANASIDERVIRRIETGKANPTIRTLEKIASGLGVSVNDLLENL